MTGTTQHSGPWEPEIDALAARARLAAASAALATGWLQAMDVLVGSGKTNCPDDWPAIDLALQLHFDAIIQPFIEAWRGMAFEHNRRQVMDIALAALFDEWETPHWIRDKLEPTMSRFLGNVTSAI